MSTTPTQETAIALPSLKHLYIAVAILVVAIVGGMIIHGKIMASATAQEQIVVAQKAAAPVISANDAIIKGADSSNAQTAAQLAQNLALINAAKSQPVTPVDYAAISAMIANQINAAKGTVTTQTAPDGTSTTTTPTLQLKDYAYTCQECQLNFKAAQTTITNDEAKIAALQSDKAVLTTQVKTLQTDLKGGSFGHRFLRGLEHGACGGLGAAAGIGVSRSSAGSGTSAAAGATVYGACEAIIDSRKR